MSVERVSGHAYESILIHQNTRRRLLIAGEGVLQFAEGAALRSLESAETLARLQPQFTEPVGDDELVIRFRNSPTDFTVPFEVVVPFGDAENSNFGFVLRLEPTSYGTFEEWITFIGELPSWDREVFVQLREHPPPSRRYIDPERVPVPERWRPALTALVHRLVLGEYERLSDEGFIQLDADQPPSLFGSLVERRGEPLVDLPAEAWEESNMDEDPGQPGSWRVMVPLWTVNGQSDLSLEATVDDTDDDFVPIRLDNIEAR